MNKFTDNQAGTSYFATIWSAIAAVGWYVLAIAITLWYAFPYVQGKYASWKLRRDEQEYAAKYHKNPDLLQERLSAVEASRQNMQEEYYQKCLLVQQEGRDKRGKSKGAPTVTLNNNNDNNASDHAANGEDSNGSCFTERKYKSLKGEYNPLMGDSSRGYRPPKRSCCGKGGGCG